MANRLDKVSGRYRELTGKSFKKIPEAVLNTENVIAELKESIDDLMSTKPRDDLQIQKMQSSLIMQQRKLNDLSRSNPK